MAIGRTDARRNPAIPMAVTGRPFVWMSRAEPIWASGQGDTTRRRVTGRTHDRIRTAADILSYPLEPRGLTQDDTKARTSMTDNHVDAGPGRPAFPSMAGWLAALKDAARRARARWPRQRARPSLTAASQPASEGSGRGGKTALQPNRKTSVEEGRGRTARIPGPAIIPGSPIGCREVSNQHPQSSAPTDRKQGGGSAPRPRQRQSL